MTETRHTTVLDTGLQYLGNVYAKALLGATEKSSVTETVLDELHSLVVDVLDVLPQMEAFLASPRIPFEAKEQLLDRTFQGKMSQLLINFVKVLIRRGRFDAIRAVELAAKRIWNENRGRIAVQVTTAEPLDAGDQSQIVAQLSAALGREVDVQSYVDTELIGGMVIRIGDTVYDGSVANQLRQWRGELVARASQTLRSQSERFAVAN